MESKKKKKKSNNLESEVFKMLHKIKKGKKYL